MATRNIAVEYLTMTKIGEKGQLTVPKQFREDLGLEDGSPFAVLRLGDGLLLMPEQGRFTALCARVSNALTSAGVAPQEILDTLPDARARVYARIYRTRLGGATRRRAGRRAK